MTRTFNYTVSHSPLPCVPQMPPGNGDFAMGHQRCQDALANWGTNRCSKACPHGAGQWCFPQCKSVPGSLQTRRKAVKGVRTASKAVKQNLKKWGNPPCKYFFSCSGIHTELLRGWVPIRQFPSGRIHAARGLPDIWMSYSKNCTSQEGCVLVQLWDIGVLAHMGYGQGMKETLKN